MEPNAEPLVIGAAGCRPDIVSHHAVISAKGPAMATLISALITFVVIILVLYLVNLLPIDGRAKKEDQI